MLGQKVKTYKNVKVIPDGGGEFTRQMGMLVRKRPGRFWLSFLEICNGNK